MDFALGELGLLPDVFWALTWEEYDRMARGYYVRYYRQWEHTRELLAQQYNLNLPKDERPKSAKELMRLPTDAAVADTVANRNEELRAFKARMQEELRNNAL